MNNSEGQTQEPVGGMKWVSAENNPPQNGYYICWCKDNDKGLIHFHKDTGWQNGFYDELVTHWMYLIPPDQFTPPPAPIKTEVEDEMNKAIKCLALELPEPVWKDVNEKWQSLRNMVIESNKRIRELESVPPPSPLGIDVEAIAESLARDKYKGNMRLVGSYCEGFKAGYAACPIPDRKNQLESGIKNFLLWLKEKRPSMTGHGAPIMILEELLNNKTNDLIKSSTEINRDYQRGVVDGMKNVSQSSTSEEEKELWNEVGASIQGFQNFEFYEHKMNELLSTYKISKR